MNRIVPVTTVLILLVAQAVLYPIIGWDGIETVLHSASSILNVPYNTLIVLLGTGALGLVAGVIGLFAVLRRRSLVGDAVAHAALPGLAIAFLIVRERNFVILLTGALVAGVIGSMVISWLQHNTRIKADAAIGIVLSVFFGFGIVLSGIIQRDPTGRQAGLDSYLLGMTAGLVSQDLILISLVAFNILALIIIFYKEFLLLSFDPGFAAVQRWPVLGLDLLIMGLLVLATIIGLPAVGVVLMAAMLIIPGVAARFWTNRLDRMLILAGFLGMLTGAFGTWVSSLYADMPTGPVIVLTAAVICIISMLIAPRRGVISRFREHLRLQGKVARQNLLRSAYELTERYLPERKPFSVDQLIALRAWTSSQADSLLRSAAARKDVEPVEDGQWRLTEKGLTGAMEVARSHRLWEMYLVEQASIAADHVDRDADELEHVLTPEILTQLEEKLKTDGRWPEVALPQSVHPVTEKN